MMKKNLRLGAAAILGVGLFMAACSKNNDNGPTATPNEMKLEAHSWKITAATVSDSTVTDSTIFSTCMEDDSLDFTSSHNYGFSDGSTVCDSTVLPYGSGTWALNTTEDTLMLKSGSVTWNWQVQNLTDSTLQVSYADSLNHVAVTKSLTFVK